MNKWWVVTLTNLSLGDDGALTYNEAADTCDAARRLSARRRSGGSWGGSSSWSSSRRRAPPAPPTSPRRRAPSAPTAYSPRLRAATPSPPPPSVRRRAPPPPVPTPLESRRRTTSMNGQSYTVSPRRRFPGDFLWRDSLSCWKECCKECGIARSQQI